MKLFLCLVIVAFVAGAQALTDEQKAKVKQWSDDCRTQTGVSQELIDKILSNGEFTDDPKMKTYVLCFSKKAGTMNDAGEVQTDRIKTQLKKVETNDEEVDKIITKCVVKKDTPEETAFETFKCLYASKPKFTSV